MQSNYSPSPRHSSAYIHKRSWGRSVGIVSDYKVDDQGSIPAEATDFSSSLCVYTSSEAHPASYPLLPGVLSPGVKRGRGVTLTNHHHLVLRLRMSSSYISSPPLSPVWRWGESFTCTLVRSLQCFVVIQN
jgi:hypothetical protein